MKLTDEQVENWRKILLKIIGQFALVAPREEIENMAEAYQRMINQGKS